MVSGERAIDRRRAWLQRQAVIREDRGDQLAAVTQCLCDEASRLVRLQQDLLSSVFTRRGLRALRPTARSKRTHIHSHGPPAFLCMSPSHTSTINQSINQANQLYYRSRTDNRTQMFQYMVEYLQYDIELQTTVQAVFLQRILSRSLNRGAMIKVTFTLIGQTILNCIELPEYTRLPF